MIPVPEYINANNNLLPPTERDAPVNPKYKYNKTFVRQSFHGTTVDMTYMSSYCSPATKKKEKKRKLFPIKTSEKLHKESPWRAQCSLLEEACAN